MTFRLRPLLTLLVLLASCTDPTGNTPAGITITVAKVSAPSTTLQGDTAARMACSAELEAKVGGNHGEIWYWVDASALWFFGSSTTPGDSSQLPRSQVAAAWGRDSIGAGQMATAQWDFSATAPFAATMKFRYKNAKGDIATSEASFRCGLPSTPAAPPQITQLGFTPGWAVPQRGVISVDFAATNPSGIWKTILRLSGPCEIKRTLAEGLSNTATHTVAMSIPVTCWNGSSPTITAYAFDASLQSASRSITGPPLIDTTAPTVQLNAPGGTYFADDSIPVSITASDNRGLTWAVWDVEPAGYRDSSSLSGGYLGGPIRIAARRAWVGPDGQQITLYVRDASGLVSSKVESAPGAFRIYPVFAGQVVTRDPHLPFLDAAIDSKRRQLYLLPPNNYQILIYALPTLQAAGSLLATGAAGVDLTASQDTLLVSLSDARELVVFDLTTSPPTRRAFLDVVPVGTRNTPRAIRTATNGKALITLAGAAGTPSAVVSFDLGRQIQEYYFDADPTLGPDALVRSLDHSALIANSGTGFFRRYLTPDDSFGQAASLPFYSIAMDGAGRSVAVGMSIYDADLNFVRRLNTPNGAIAAAAVLSPDGQTILFQHGNGVVRANALDGAIIDRIALPYTPRVLRLSDDGSLLIAFLAPFGSSGYVSAIQLR
jgi:hypothetical protein